MKKMVFVMGLGVGYILGARAGRKRYDQIVGSVKKVWDSDPIQKQVVRVEDLAKAKAGATVASGVKLVADQFSKAVDKAMAAPKRGGTPKPGDPEDLPGTVGNPSH